ncbi:MAG TPA: hypothetical protein ENK10_04945 [Acidobacteria bacterium]|nr:hypothetical protein [Acidobacteriota bacterium]
MYPVIIDFGTITIGGHAIPIAIGGYGVFFLLAVITGWAMASYLGRQVYPDAPWTDIYFGSVAAGFIGAKVTNLIVFLPDITAGKKSFIGVLMGGGVWLGGAIAGVGFCALMLYKHKLDPGIVANGLFTGVPLAHGVGRIGCLLGGCCYGAPTDVPWAIVYTNPIAHRINGTPLNVPLHPNPIYEFVLEMINFVICYSLWRRKVPPWTIFAAWTGLYGAERFVLEFFRSDPRGQYSLFTTSQWISLAMVAVSLATFAWIRRNIRAAEAA